MLSQDTRTAALCREDKIRQQARVIGGVHVLDPVDADQGDATDSRDVAHEDVIDAPHAVLGRVSIARMRPACDFPAVHETRLLENTDGGIIRLGIEVPEEYGGTLPGCRSDKGGDFLGIASASERTEREVRVVDVAFGTVGRDTRPDNKSVVLIGPFRGYAGKFEMEGLESWRARQESKPLVDPRKGDIDLSDTPVDRVRGEVRQLLPLSATVRETEVMACFLHTHHVRHMAHNEMGDGGAAGLPGGRVVPQVVRHYPHSNLPRKEEDMSTDGISETTFLVTELRYTLGQLHVQLGDVLPEQRSRAYSGQSMNSVLQDMMQGERSFQQRVAQLLSVEIPSRGASGAAPSETDFERARVETVAMLERAEPKWPQSLIDLVKEQVAADRDHATAIATLREQIFSAPAQQNQPLTEQH